MVRGKSQAQKLKTVLPFGGVTLFTLLLLFWLMPLEQFNPLRDMDFTDLVFSYWLTFVGLVFMTLGIVSLPDEKGAPARITGFFFMGFGLVAFIFAVITLIQGIGVITGEQSLRVFATILFGGASIILLADLIPRIVNGEGLIENVDQNT